MRSRWAPPPKALYTAIVALVALLVVGFYRSTGSAQPSAARVQLQSQQSAGRTQQSHTSGARSMSMSTASPDGCRPRQQFSTAEQQARREYQEFLLEDAKRFEAPMLEWAGWNGPWIEDLWLEHWKERWAAGADTGDRIYIPVLWINCYFKCDKPRKKDMLQYLTTLKPEYSYMSVYMMDKGMVIAGMEMPPGLDLLLFSACATTRGVRSVPIPLLKKVLKPQGGLPKDVMVNFLGDLTSHRLREEMARALIAEPGFMIGKAKHEDTFHIIERSNFTLTPRGHGSASWRMYETLQLGSIPIFIWDYDPILPYQELLDWNEIAIVVHRKEIKYIPHLVKQFDVPRAQRRLAEISALWSYEGVQQYMVDRLLKEPCFPAPVSVIQDRYGWEQG